MLISVIIPVYNSEKYLCRCLDSVIEQSLKNIEIICINDGSTDNSLHLLQKYSKQDDRVKIYNQENQGAGAARNKGLKLATGKYVVFADPDDFYPDKDVLSDLYRAIENNKVNIAGGGLIEFLPDMRYRKEYAEQELKTFTKNCILKYSDYQYDYFFQRFIYSRKFLIQQKIEFPLYRRQQDIVFFVKAMIKAKKFYALKRTSYCYRVDYKLKLRSKQEMAETVEVTQALLHMCREYKLRKLYNRILKRYIFQKIEQILVEIGLSKIQYMLHKYIFQLRFKIFFNKFYKDNVLIRRADL